MTIVGEVMHIVLFEWKEEATPEAIALAVDGLKGLKATVPGIQRAFYRSGFLHSRQKLASCARRQIRR